MQILIGISIGWITMGVGVLAFLEWQNRKLFGKKKTFADRISEGWKDEIRNFKQ